MADRVSCGNALTQKILRDIRHGRALQEFGIVGLQQPLYLGFKCSLTAALLIQKRASTRRLYLES